MLSSLGRRPVHSAPCKFRWAIPISILPSHKHFIKKGHFLQFSGIRSISFSRFHINTQATALTETELALLNDLEMPSALRDLLTLPPDQLEESKKLGFLRADLVKFDPNFGHILRHLNSISEYALAKKLYEKFGPFNKLDGFAAREYVIALKESRDSKDSSRRIRDLLSQSKQVSSASDPIHIAPQESFLPRFNALLTLLILVALGYNIYLTITEKQGEEIVSILKTPKFNQVQDVKITLEDVKGNSEAKEELYQLVEFLKHPSKFAGVKMPKGVLLSGPPGTGKTLLARALAGEAGVPFLAVSGSEFDEVFVGVGAKRIRELFQTARQLGSCIIFIDEIDTIGGQRKYHKVSGISSTLNQLLVELDGFNNRDGVIIIGATNIPDSLDPALVRPGRFDRQVHVGLPSLRERKEIIEYYLSKHKCAESLKTRGIDILAEQTVGLSGAQLDNMVSLASFEAVKRGTNVLNLDLMERALLDSAIGKEKRTMVLSTNVKNRTAIHESGHALVGMYSKTASPIRIVTIVPRGPSLGLVSRYSSSEISKSKAALLDDIRMALGGRAAEEIVYGFDGVTTGAGSDIEAATQLAYNMVTLWGMSDKAGPIRLGGKIQAKDRNLIESEVRSILEAAYEDAKALLLERRVELDKLSRALMTYETLTREEIDDVLSGKTLDKI